MAYNWGLTLILDLFILFSTFAQYTWYSGGVQAVGRVVPSRLGSLCWGGSDSPQHQHQPTLIDKCVGYFRSPDRTSRD